MKKIALFFLGLLITGYWANAQSIPNSKGKIGPGQKIEWDGFPTFKTAQDSQLFPNGNAGIDCAGQYNVYLYYAQGNRAPIVGYISGTIADTFQYQSTGYWYYITEQAQYFEFSGSHKIVSVGAWFGAKTVVGGIGDDFTLRIYSDSTFGSIFNFPQILGSLTYNTDNIQAGNSMTTGYNEFTFTPPINFTNKFLVSFEVKTPDSDDTLGIIITNPDTSSDPGLNGGCGFEKNYWLQKQMGAEYNDPANFMELFIRTWVPARTNWGSGKGLDGDLIILPTIEIQVPTAKDEPYGVKNGDLRVYGAFPNPSCNNSKILFELDKNSDVRIQLMDVTGKFLIDERMKGIAGMNEYNFDFTNVPNGTYTYIVRTHEGRIASKIMVAK